MPRRSHGQPLPSWQQVVVTHCGRVDLLGPSLTANETIGISCRCLAGACTWSSNRSPILATSANSPTSAKDLPYPRWSGKLIELIGSRQHREVLGQKNTKRSCLYQGLVDDESLCCRRNHDYSCETFMGKTRVFASFCVRPRLSDRIAEFAGTPRALASRQVHMRTRSSLDPTMQFQR